jgi:hypothetical protein
MLFLIISAGLVINIQLFIICSTQRSTLLPELKPFQSHEVGNPVVKRRAKIPHLKR